jgi:hypothetical protein
VTYCIRRVAGSGLVWVGLLAIDSLAEHVTSTTRLTVFAAWPEAYSLLQTALNVVQRRSRWTRLPMPAHAHSFRGGGQLYANGQGGVTIGRDVWSKNAAV